MLERMPEGVLGGMPDDMPGRMHDVRTCGSLNVIALMNARSHVRNYVRPSSEQGQNPCQNTYQNRNRTVCHNTCQITYQLTWCESTYQKYIARRYYVRTRSVPHPNGNSNSNWNWRRISLDAAGPCGKFRV